MVTSSIVAVICSIRYINLTVEKAEKLSRILREGTVRFTIMDWLTACRGARFSNSSIELE